MPITKAPWKNMAPTPLIFGKWVMVILQDPEAAPPVLAFGVVPRAVTSPLLTWAAGKGSGSLLFSFQKTNVKDLQDVFRLTDRKPFPVNFRICPIHMPSV